MGKGIREHSMLRYIIFYDDNGKLLHKFELDSKGKHIKPVVKIDFDIFSKDTKKQTELSEELLSSNITPQNQLQISDSQLSVIQIESLLPHWDEDITLMPPNLDFYADSILDESSFF